MIRFSAIAALFAVSVVFSFQDLRLVIFEKDSLLTSRGQTLVTAGLPFAKGEITSLSQLAVYNGAGSSSFRPSSRP